jgi:hypothetical protein
MTVRESYSRWQDNFAAYYRVSTQRQGQSVSELEDRRRHQRGDDR